MKAHVDRFGRIVIPRKLRDRLRLKAGDEIEISEMEGGLFLESTTEAPVVEQLENGLLVLNVKVSEDIPDLVAWDREQRMKKVLGL